MLPSMALHPPSAEINVKSAGGKCTLTESSHSPVSDPNSPGLLSIGAFPPRPF